MYSFPQLHKCYQALQFKTLVSYWVVLFKTLMAMHCVKNFTLSTVIGKVVKLTCSNTYTKVYLFEFLKGN